MLAFGLPTLCDRRWKVEGNQCRDAAIWSQHRFELALTRDEVHKLLVRHAFDPDDYAVVVKLRADPPNPWKWEIYCAGKRLPIEQSKSRFGSMGAAHSAGKEALSQLIAKRSS